ncbi:MFS transporter [Maribacter ulvicola]|uniref:Major Facilitator Superfamily protein n=1 Tax=Maribacter ulvicola TaxID=228959 RepID=A0A1N6U082_9FLAO|nr:MFS transporter [Maribacter ulvicola]SIQ58746.1 Major Facilitator Superfamily protein [Maribacter ulvicola]
MAIQVSVTVYIAAQYEGGARMKMIAWQGMAIELGGIVFLAIGGVLGEIFWQYPFYIYLIALVCLLLVFKTLPKIKKSVKEEETFAKVTTKEKLKTRIIIASSLLAMMLFFISFVTLPLYLPANFGFSEFESGYLMAFISVIAIVTASQMPRMVKLLGDGKTVTLGFVFFMLGYIVLALVTSVPFLILTAICIEIGFGFTIPLLNHRTIEVSNTQNQGKI